MSLEVTVQLNRDDVTAYWRRCAKSKAARSWQYQTIVTWSIVIVFVTFLPAQLSRQPFTMAHYIAAVAAIAYVIWSSLRRYSAADASRLLDSTQGRLSYTVTISEPRLTWRDDRQSTSLHWSAVTDINEDEYGLHLTVYGGEWAVIIPRRGFESEDQYITFAAAARKYWLSHPGPEQACPACGYDLHAASVGGCPECGWRRTPTETMVSPSGKPGAL